MNNQLSARDIERRAWQINELFKVINHDAPCSVGDQVSISELACLGRQLAAQLALYAAGDLGCMLGMEALTTTKTRLHAIEEVLESYRKTIESADALIRAINLSDLKHVRVTDKDSIEEAVLDLASHCDAARNDFLEGLDNE